MSLITGQPKWLIGLFGGGVAVAAYAISTGNWEGNTQIQFLSIGLIGVGVLAMVTDDRPNPVSMGEVVDSNYSMIREAQTKGRLPSGSLSSMMEARKVISDGNPVYWEHGIRVENLESGNPVYVMRTELIRDTRGRIDISGVTKKADWKASDRPDMVVLEPPDMTTYLRLRRVEDIKKGVSG